MGFKAMEPGKEEAIRAIANCLRQRWGPFFWDSTESLWILWNHIQAEKVGFEKHIFSQLGICGGFQVSFWTFQGAQKDLEYMGWNFDILLFDSVASHAMICGSCYGDQEHYPNEAMQRTNK